MPQGQTPSVASLSAWRALWGKWQAKGNPDYQSRLPHLVVEPDSILSSLKFFRGIFPRKYPDASRLCGKHESRLTDV
jgi:hypothetical protein